MTTQRLKTLRRLQRFAQLREARDRIVLAQSITIEAKARQEAEAVRSRLDGLMHWRAQLIKGSPLLLDRYAWALDATSYIDEEDLAARLACKQRQAITEQNRNVLAKSHARLDAATQRRDHLQQVLATRDLSRTHEHAIESWLVLRGAAP